jgi:pimeloyl-ACP methyl ester carboxylesterase
VNSAPEELQLRVHGSPELPTLIYLPGIHGDWTLVSSFRHAVRDRVRIVEFTYPRTLTWSLEDYGRAVLNALAEHGITHGWLLGESFGSQVAWSIVRLASAGGEPFRADGVILAGGFARYPILLGVRVVRWLNARVSPRVMRAGLRLYVAYARLRHRRAPETLASLDEFIARRTEPDRHAILHRYGLILASDAGQTAATCRLPTFCLSGFVDPVVPWLFSIPAIRRACPGFRGSRIILNADHNVLGTAPRRAAEQILAWMSGVQQSFQK